jgi:isopenicillin N synthase-like dioxygenase
MASEIPLSLADSPSAFLSALSSTGFLHLSLGDDTSRFVSQRMVDRAFENSSQLYDVSPLADRMRLPRDDDTNFNGHFAVGSTYLNREGGQQKPDWKEGFSYGRYPVGESWSQGLPDILEKRRSELEAFSDGCYNLMLAILDKLSLAFELSEDYFRSCHQHKGANSVTFLNYPPLPPGTKITGQDIRAGAHKDWGSITFLFQETGGQAGLQLFLSDDTTEQNGVKLMAAVDLENGQYTVLSCTVRTGMFANLVFSSGAWHDAPIVANTVLINLGLMMEAWTGGLCKATLHRVIFPKSPSSKARRSIAYFGTPDPAVLLTPVHKGVVLGNVPVPTVSEFFRERLKKAEVPKNERTVIII